MRIVGAMLFVLIAIVVQAVRAKPEAPANDARFLTLETQLDGAFGKGYAVICDTKTGEQFLWVRQGYGGGLAKMEQRCK